MSTGIRFSSEQLTQIIFELFDSSCVIFKFDKKFQFWPLQYERTEVFQWLSDASKDAIVDGFHDLLIFKKMEDVEGSSEPWELVNRKQLKETIDEN